MTRPARRSLGFTLIEMLATISALAILGSIASFLIVDAVDGYVAASTHAQLHTELSLAMERITREIRRIELNPTVPGAVPYITGVDSSFLNWRDGDDDDYALTYAGGNLTLQFNGGPADLLLTDLTTCTFKAYDQSNGLLPGPLAGTDCYPIRRISIDLAISRSGVTESVSTRVFLRSTMQGGG